MFLRISHSFPLISPSFCAHFPIFNCVSCHHRENLIYTRSDQAHHDHFQNNLNSFTSPRLFLISFFLDTNLFQTGVCSFLCRLATCIELNALQSWTQHLNHQSAAVDLCYSSIDLFFAVPLLPHLLLTFSWLRYQFLPFQFGLFCVVPAA